MWAEFFVWLAEPALSSAPHFEGAQFSVKGLSAEGPGRNGFWANAELAKTIAIAAARIGSLMAASSLGLVLQSMVPQGAA